MLAVTHFAVGLLFAVLFIVPAVERFEDSTIMVTSGVWALGPDIDKFVPALDALHESVWSNVFWLHPTMDAFETSFPNAEAFVVLSMLVIAVAMTERREMN